MKYCFLFLKKLKIIQSVGESKINTSLILFMIQYFILPILLYNPITDVNVALPPVGKYKIFQSNFLVKHNLLRSFPVKDCNLKQWKMESQEKYFILDSRRAETDGGRGKVQRLKKGSFLTFCSSMSFFFSGTWYNPPQA